MIQAHIYSYNNKHLSLTQLLAVDPKQEKAVVLHMVCGASVPQCDGVRVMTAVRV